MRDLKVTWFTEDFEAYFPARRGVYIVSILHGANNL